MEEITRNDIYKLLDLAYNTTLNGIPGFESAEELAQDYLKKAKSNKDAIKKLTFWQVTKCTTSGFLTGLGGIITMPVAIPVNISSTIYVQIRMIAAIAYMKGYDIRDDRVKTLACLCLCGNGANEIAREVGIKIGQKISESIIKKIPGKVLIEINKKVGFRLLTKFGEKGIINLCKVIPVAGGIVGGGFDLASTKTIAKVAEKTFI